LHGPDYADVLSKLKRSSFYKAIDAQVLEPDKSMPEPMEIKDVGDIFNPQYLINWERPDPRALFDNSWEPIEQD
jgi:hypothetical protein